MTHTSLRWPYRKLEQHLAQQVDLGVSITRELADVTTLGQLGDAVDLAGWHERNRTILKQAFTTAEVMHEYDPIRTAHVVSVNSYRQPTEHDRLVRARETHAERLRRLKRVQERCDLYDQVEDASDDLSADNEPVSSTVFIVHGHDEHTKQLVARALHQLTQAEPVILHEQADVGATIIEKFERHASTAAAAVVILSPDDVGRSRTTDKTDEHFRARQNVVYELGRSTAGLGAAR